MITFQRYNKILRARKAKHTFLTDLIYSRGQEKITENLTRRLGDILIGMDEGNYTTATLNDFANIELGIEEPMLKQMDFSRLEKDTTKP